MKGIGCRLVKHRDVEMQRCSCRKVHMCKITREQITSCKVKRCKDTETQRCVSSEVQRNRVSKAQRCKNQGTMHKEHYKHSASKLAQHFKVGMAPQDRDSSSRLAWHFNKGTVLQK